MLELVMPGQQDWLGNRAPEAGCMVVGARYTFTAAPIWTDDEHGTVGWEWDLHGTTHPVDGTFFITADEDVRLVVRLITVHVAALACAQNAYGQLAREAERLRERHLEAWPSRETWPEDEYDGYNPAARSFESLRLAMERAEWMTSVGRFLRRGEEHA